MNQILTLDEFLSQARSAIEEKKSLFEVDIDNTRPNQNKDFPTWYIPFNFINKYGKKSSLNLKVMRQVISSNAKVPSGQGDAAKNAQITFRSVDESDMEKTDHDHKNWKDLLHANNQLIEALNIIANAYDEIAKRDIIPYEEDKFSLGNNKNVSSFRQVERKATKEEIAEDMALPKEERTVAKTKKVKLPYALFRVKLTADPVSKKLGRYQKNSKTGMGEYVRNVFDTRKCEVDARGNKKPVIAKLKNGDEYIDLTVTNSKHFITYMSIVGGVLTVDNLVVSKQGISLALRFRELHVIPHRRIVAENINTTDLNEMNSVYDGAYADDIDISTVDEPEQKPEPKKDKFKKEVKKPDAKPVNDRSTKISSPKDEEEVVLDEPEENDD